MYVSVVVTLSRIQHVKLVLEQLHALELGPHVAELVLAIDNPKIKTTQLDEQLRGAKKWRNITMLKTDSKTPPKFDMHVRRNRIAALRNATKAVIGGSNFVFSFEDDTLIPANAMVRLLERWQILDHPGFIEGVEVGRWGHPYIGAWTVNDLQVPTEYISLGYRPDGFERIDIGGFYCYVTTTALYKSIDYKWNEPMGPDAYFTLELRKKGYLNYIDWSVTCGHDAGNEILYPDENAVQIRQYSEGGKWKSVIIRRES